MTLKWRDLVMPGAAAAAVDNKTADEIALDVIAKTGITFAGMESARALNENADAAEKDGETNASI